MPPRRASAAPSAKTSRRFAPLVIVTVSTPCPKECKCAKTEGPSSTLIERPHPTSPVSPVPKRNLRFSPEVEGSSGPIFGPQAPVYSPTSPSYIPVTQDCGSYSPTSPRYTGTQDCGRYSPTSPSYNPTSPAFNPVTLPVRRPPTPAYSPIDPNYVPTSPTYSPVFRDHHQPRPVWPRRTKTGASDSVPVSPPRSPIPRAGRKGAPSKFNGPLRSPVLPSYKRQARFSRASQAVRTPAHGFRMALLLAAKRSTRMEVHRGGREKELDTTKGIRRHMLLWGHANDNAVYVPGRALRNLAARKRKEHEAEQKRLARLRTLQHVEDVLRCDEDFRECMRGASARARA